MISMVELYNDDILTESYSINLAIFQRETGAKLDHANPPSGFVHS